MTKISLRGYNHEIEGLIEHGHRLDEAVAHCRHILKTYPKHLETYRLLGKAYLEVKRYDQAVDIFQRVLVSSPEDFVSHVGMSIIADDRGKLDDAIWHMERAFEVQPSNAAIQAEMQRLFGRRDGVEPPKIRLTRGALAHMYVQGELFTQAISEIQAVLGHDAKRADMQVLLARAYFRNGQQAEALGVCEKVLAAAPFCLEANRLMAEIVKGTQSPEAAEDIRRRVFELDPYAEFAGPDLFASDTVADGAVSLDRLDYSGPEPEAGLTPGIGSEPMRQAAGGSISQPTWMTRSQDELNRAPVEDGSEDDIPAFMRETGWKPTDSAVPDASETEGEFTPAAVPGDLPEWVKALAPNDESKEAGVLESDSVSAEGVAVTEEIQKAAPVAEEDQGIVAGRSDSRQDLGQGSGSGEGMAFTEAQGYEPVQPSQPVGSQAMDSIAQEQDDSLAWLEALAEKQGANPEELLSAPESRSTELPSWLSDYQDHSAPKTEGLVSTQPGDDSVPQSSQFSNENAEPPVIDSQGQVQSKEPASPTEEKPDDWLKSLSDKDAFANMEAANDNDETPFNGDGMDVAWPGQSPRPKVGEEPSWLGGDSAGKDTSQSGVGAETSGESGSPADLPAWLADLDKPEADVAGPIAQETSAPSLQEYPAAQPEAAAATLPYDWEPAGTSGLQKAEGSAEQESPESGVTSSIPDGFDVPGGLHVEEAVQQVGSLPSKTRPADAPGRLGTLALGGAQAEMTRGNIAAALDLYAKLIRKGKSLEDIIRHLRDALYRYPVEVPIWQSLGDAYMRANRLQEALDAYTKAEELLR